MTDTQFDLEVFGRHLRFHLLQVLCASRTFPHLFKLTLEDLSTLLCHQATVWQANLTHPHVIDACTMHSFRSASVLNSSVAKSNTQ